MPRILRTTLLDSVAQAVSSTSTTDLPVNPLSAIILTLKTTNATTTLSNYSSIAALLALISQVTVSYRGANIIDGSLTDIAVLSAALSGWAPFQLNKIDTDTNVRSITMPIVFGRRPYDPIECFPATRRGDLQLKIVTAAAQTGVGTAILQVETIELLDAQPAAFLKQTTTTQVFNSTGDHDIELPISNDILGMLLHSPALPAGTAYTNWFNKVRIQVDNVETILSETNWESLHGELRRKIPSWPDEPHTHSIIAAAHTHTISGSGAAPAAYAQGNTLGLSADANGATLTTGTAARTGITGIQPATVTATANEQRQGFDLLDAYAYIDLDPLMDGQYALRTRDAARVNLRINSTLASANAGRVMPIELVVIAAPGAGG